MTHSDYPELYLTDGYCHTYPTAETDPSCFGDLAIRARSGDRSALDSLFLAYKGFICSIAEEKADNLFPADFLVSEGCTALYIAVMRYSEDSDISFPEYAQDLIRGVISEITDPGNTEIRFTAESFRPIRSFLAEYDRIREETGRDPSPSDFGLTEEIPLKQFSRLVSTFRKSINCFSPPEDPDKDPVSSGSDTEANILGFRREKVLDALSALTEKEKKVIEMRFGLNGEKQTGSLSQIGDDLGITRSRARHLLYRATRKLRNVLWGDRFADSL